ncbi:MAG: RNA methyltransferase [Bacteroidales bacterium]|nr:RNA methyltransferase [Bacteroidales bacterium]
MENKELTHKKLSIADMNRISKDEFKTTDKMPLILVLDNVRSLNNIGAMFRTSDAFLVESIYLCGISSPPPSPEIHKTALGAEDVVDWKYFEDTHNAVDKLKQMGYIVYSIEQVENSIKLDKIQLDKNFKYAVIMGNEVKGVQQSVVDISDGCIEIPQFGTKHSLNVSVTAGLVIWDFFKKLKL